jgi:archaellin
MAMVKSASTIVYCTKNVSFGYIITKSCGHAVLKKSYTYINKLLIAISQGSLGQGFEFSALVQDIG